MIIGFGLWKNGHTEQKNHVQTVLSDW